MLLILEWDGCHWQERLKCCLREIEGADFHGIERLAKGFGGMGSFNDLIVGQTKNTLGQFSWRDGSREMNDKLELLRERAYSLVEFIKRNYEIRN